MLLCNLWHINICKITFFYVDKYIIANINDKNVPAILVLFYVIDLVIILSIRVCGYFSTVNHVINGIMTRLVKDPTLISWTGLLYLPCLPLVVVSPLFSPSLVKDWQNYRYSKCRVDSTSEITLYMLWWFGSFFGGCFNYLDELFVQTDNNYSRIDWKGLIFAVPNRVINII